MRAFVVLGFLLVAAVAGCATPAPQRAAPTDVEALPGEVINLDRPVAATVTFYEDVVFDDQDFGFARVTNEDPWPRNFTLEYNGIQGVLDEFGRSVPAFTFRWPEPFLESTGTFNVGSGGIDITSTWTVHELESGFDRADGRWMGYQDIDSLYHMFIPPEYRSPAGFVPTGLMILKIMDGDYASEVWVDNFTYEGVTHEIYLHFIPFDKFRPLEGACDMWEPRIRIDPPFQPTLPPVPQGPPVPEEIEEPRYEVMCTEANTLVPLWNYYGSRSEMRAMQVRTSPSIELHDFAGAVLDPVAYEARAWDERIGPIPAVGGLLGPTLVPPSDRTGDWADEIGDRVDALYLSPGYVQYRLQSETPFLPMAWYGIPSEASTLPLPLPPIGPQLPDIAFDSYAWLIADDGASSYWGNVHTRKGTAEQPDLHVAQPQGASGLGSFSEMKAADLPPLAPAGAIADGLHMIVPPVPDMVMFYLINWPEVFEEPWVTWSLLQDCTSDRDGGWADINAKGFASSAGLLPRGGEECGTQAGASADASNLADRIRKAGLARNGVGPDLWQDPIMARTPQSIWRASAPLRGDL